MILLCFVYILPFLLGTSFPTPSTWKASSAHMSSCSISSMRSSLSFPKQTWVFLTHWVLMYVFMKSGISLYYVYHVSTNMGTQIWGPKYGGPNMGLPCWLSSKEFTCHAGATGDVGSIPESGRSPGEGNGYPLQYSYLENSMDRGA